jgi:hypothetical protein
MALESLKENQQTEEEGRHHVHGVEYPEECADEQHRDQHLEEVDDHSDHKGLEEALRNHEVDSQEDHQQDSQVFHSEILQVAEEDLSPCSHRSHEEDAQAEAHLGSRDIHEEAKVASCNRDPKAEEGNHSYHSEGLSQEDTYQGGHSHHGKEDTLWEAQEA